MADGNIFISYRRGSDSNAAGRLYDRLERSFDRARLFFDIDSIPLGVDFAAHIDAEVAKCDVQLVVIGPGWQEEVDRLSDPDDFVRIEIEAALKRPEIPVVPILLEDAQMPGSENLPESLHPLLRRNAIDVGHAQFSQAVDGRLVPALRAAMVGKEKPPPQPARWWRRLVAALLLGIVAAGGWYVYEQNSRFGGLSGAPSTVTVGRQGMILVGRGLCSSGEIDFVEWPEIIVTLDNNTLQTCASTCLSMSNCTGVTYNAPKRQCVIHSSKITRIMGPDERLYCYRLRTSRFSG